MGVKMLTKSTKRKTQPQNTTTKKEVSQELRFIKDCIKTGFINAAQLRLSFVFSVIAMCLNNISFIIIWVLVVKAVGPINGWGPYEIIALQGFTSIAFGLPAAFTAGLLRLPVMVQSGSFDSILLSPKNILSRTAFADFSADAFGDVVFGIICLSIYLIVQDQFISNGFIILINCILISLIFFSVILCIFSLSFYITDSELVCTKLLHTFLTPALMHGGLFDGFLKFFFVFIIPSLAIGALPTEMLIEFKASQLIIMFCLTCFWLFFSIKFFYMAVKRYESGNLFTFGR